MANKQNTTGEWMIKKKTLFPAALLFLLALFSFQSCEQDKAPDQTKTAGTSDSVKVTFIELGSVNCVPCRMMQPVMEKLEKNFPNHLEVLFYDVWTKEEASYAREYSIQVIPTQVFLDASGKEFYRHAGFFPYDEIVEILKQKGVEN